MKKVFKRILLIYLNISLTTLKSVETANRDVKKPCEDFFEYACSNYSLEISQKLEHQVNENLLSHLTSVMQEKPPGMITFYEKIITYFEACNNKPANCITEYIVPFVQLLADKTYNFWPLLGKMQSYGFNNVILNHHITRNMDNTLNIHLSSVDLVKDEPIDSDNIMLLKVFDNKQEMQTWLNINLKWQDIATEYNQAKYKAIPKKNFQKNKLKFDIGLHSYLENLLQADIDNVSVITIDEKYYEFLIETYSSLEERKQICEYLVIKFLYYLERDAAKDIEPVECVKDLRNKFDLGINYIYYKQFFQWNENIYTLLVLNMFDHIKDVMSEEFKSNHLQLSDKQIEFLLNKLQALRINIGNMPHNFHFTQINQFYQDIPELSSSNYCKNHLMLLKHRFRKSLVYTQNLTYSLETDTTMATTTSLPFYVPKKNMIVIPFGSFQLPLFHYQQTSLQQLSLFGFVMTHEFAHAFDTVGLNFNHQGSELIHPSDILKHANFTASVKCMQAQEPSENIHERIADLFAVRVVYRIYSEYYAKPQEKDWSKEFFEHMAQFFCGNNNVRYIAHDSDPIRLRLILKNFSPFARAFACPAVSAMISTRTCRLY